MNIEQAKTEIKRSVSIYLMKDAYGNYRMARQRQRPIFMLGAPGIGKTAVISQIAQELHLPLVSYSMTHHTRQSAIGLPFIEHKTYQGQEFDVSVYTLSEIIASVYEAMEKSGKKEGILFLDEINCVSETLAPAMLQFLQYKTFGNHELPEGWIIVTAGNPHVFNHNARSFDIATMDRLKVLEVEPDYDAWRRYAATAHVHPAILSFLDVHKDYCFHVSTGVDGKIYVTPRGWEDLSDTMVLYGEKNYPVDEVLISEYLHDEHVVNAFASYLMLYGKYQQEYPVKDILDGLVTDDEKKRMEKAGWDERISVTSLILDALSNEIHEEEVRETGLRLLRDPLRELKDREDPAEASAELLTSFEKENAEKLAGNAYDGTERESSLYVLSFLHKINGITDFGYLSAQYQREVQMMNESITQIGKHLDNMFAFLSSCADEQEMLIAVTRLTADQDSARFISQHGCEAYYKYNDALNMQKRSEELHQDVENLRGKND